MNKYFKIIISLLFIVLLQSCATNTKKSQSVHGDKPLIDTAIIIVEGREDMDKKIIDGPKPYDTQFEREDKRKTITTENVKNYVTISDEYTHLKQLVSINFQGLDFKYVMSLMADIGDINILVGDEVSGTVNAKIDNVGWDIAFQTLLDMKTLVADINVEAINGIKNKLESMYENSTKTKVEEIPELEPEDKWIFSMLQNLALNVSQSMDKIRLREALHHIMYDFDSELQWYLKRTKSKQRTNISGILHKILSARVLMLSPFAPHIAEEIWEKLGNSELASKSTWPSSIGIEIDSKSIQTETLLKSIIEDINNILKVTKISPKKITTLHCRTMEI